MMIIVIGITLCLPSAGLLLIENAGQISQNIEHEAEISIFLDKTVSKDQIDFIDLSLKKNSLIKKIHFEPKLIAWEKLQSKLDVAISSSVSNNPLPDAFFISLNTLNEIDLKYKDNLEFINLIEKSKKKYNEEVSIYAMMFLFSWDNFDLFHNCLRCFNDNILNSTHYNILFNNLT